MSEYGVDWLRGAIASVSPYGIAAAASPFAPGEEAAAQARAERISRIAAAFDVSQLDAMREILREVPDAAPALARASMGDTLDDPSFLELQRFFDACVRLDASTAACSDVPQTANEGVRACAHAIERGRAGRFGFFLDDTFDGALATARATLAQAQAEYDAAQGRAHAAVAAALRREISLPQFIVMRSDLDGALPKGVRVVREAPTYVLCELDADEAVLAALERRDAAAERVAEEEEAVRARLSATMREHAGALDAAMRAFGEADVLVAAARFAKTYACAPAAVAGEGIAFDEGRYLPLEVELAAQGRAITPIALHLDGMAVLTGPNMGGKSVALRTCGFIAACAQLGLPVPARRARVALFAAIDWLGIGTEETSGGGLLSAFAREVVALRDVLARDVRPRLILLDEFARTTTPREGAALLVAIVGHLRAHGACGIAATHLSGVAETARVRHYAVRGLRAIPRRLPGGDLAKALETLAASMDYTLEDVGGARAGGADAIALASLLGVDPAVIDAAYRALEG